MTKYSLSVILILSILFPSQHLPIQTQPDFQPNLAPVSSVSLGVPGEVFIGESFSFSVTFDNTSVTEVGYGPYIDVFIPQSGADDSSVTEKEDGIVYTNVDYLGNEIRTWEFTCTENGTIIHPLTQLVVSCPVAPAGAITPFTWQLLVIELPFGSFAPDQPPATVNITAQLSDYADLSFDLPIYAQGGYRFGSDELQNPSTDPPIIGLRESAIVTPILLILDKTYNWREDETSTGINYPRQYTLSVNIPENQTITNLVISDVLPINMQFLAIESTSPAVSSCSLPSTTIPGGTLSCTFAGVVGTAGSADATIVFSFYIPLYDSLGTRVINPLTGGCVNSENPVSASADWDPLDPRDNSITATASEDPAHILEDCSHTIQKFKSIFNDNLPASYSPGDVVEYQLEFQISDYFSEDTFTVTDTFSDGQRFDTSFNPTLSIEGNSFALLESIFNSTNYSVIPDYTPADLVLPNSGKTTITFRVSDEIVTRGQLNGRLVGGCIPIVGTGISDPDCEVYNDGPTTGIIRFRTIVQEEFSDDYESGDKSVDQGDLLSDNVIAAGIILNNSDLSTTGNIASEDSTQSFVIGYGTLLKSIYAINGNTTFSSPVRLTPGDTITYRIVYTLNTSDVEDLEVTDYLPLPVLDADELSIFNDVISVAAPAAGQIKFGVSDSFRNYSGIVPVLSVDSLNNSFTLFYGDFDSVLDTPTVIDLLFTVTVSDDPFADRLYLTNQVLVYEGSTNHDISNKTSIIRFILDEPVLDITKGIVSSDRSDETYIPMPPASVAFTDPGGSCPRFGGLITSAVLDGNPIDSDISQVDAGDKVTFAVILENLGHESAYDIVAKDDLPAGYLVPAGGINLCVTNGAGTTITYTDLGGGFLGNGIELSDTAAAALEPGFDGSNLLNAAGTNIAVITFDLELAGSIQSSDTITNTATLMNYSGEEGGGDFTTEDQIDQANTIVLAPQIVKSLVTTNQTHTVGSNVAVGEIATYNFTVALPEGLTSNALITDNLPSGLAFVDCVSITPSANITTDLIGGFSAVCDDPNNPTVQSNGDLVQFSLGNLTNSNTTNSVIETITVQFTAVALNVISNQHGTTLSNSGVFSWDGGTLSSSPVVTTVVEPAISVNKTAVPTSGDAGDLITFTIVISNPVGGVDAFNMTADDIVPVELTYTPLSFQYISGLAPDSIAETPDLNAYWTSFPAGSSTTLRFTGTLKTSVTPGDRVTNDAIIKYSSLPGAPGQQSPYSPESYERTGNQSDPGLTANDYTFIDPAYVDIIIPTPLKYLIASSESHTTGTKVAIGEIVRYRLSSVIPEGTSINFQIRDLLPTGLLYLDDGTVKLAFISNGVGLTSSTITCTNDNGASGDPAVISSGLIDCAFPAGSITNAGTLNPYSPGNDPYFNFGNITNADNDVDLEYVTLEFNALVVNTIGNQIGTSLSNDFRVYEGGSQVADATNLTVTVVEPALTVNKTISAGPYDAGDLVIYSVVITAGSLANNATAFNLEFSDSVNTALQVQSHTISAPGYAVVVDGTSGNSINYTISQLNAGESVTITITALIPAGTSVYLNIPNTGRVLYTSLPDANGTSPNDTGSNNSGLPGTQNGERTGQDGVGGLNDYDAQEGETITISQPVIDKRDASPLSYTIGESVVFPIIVTLPEGITQNLEINDNLPEGLEYVSSQIISTASESGGLLALDFSGSVINPTIVSVSGSGGDVTWSFGDVTTTADITLPVLDNNSFLIRITTRVMDTLENSGGDVLANSVLLRFTNPNNGEPVNINDPPVSITLVEPVMEISKTFDPDQATVNETVQVTLVVRNTGTSPAYDVIVDDPFPTTLFQATSAVSTPADFVYESLIAGGNITVRYSGGPIEVGGSRNFIFNVTTNTGITGSSSFTNTASVTQATTLDGDNDYERDEPDVSANDVLYGISPDLRITKDDGQSTATAGNTLIYTLTVDNVGLHDAVNLTISDSVPDGTVFDSTNSSSGWSCPDGSPAATVCTLDIASLESGGQILRSFAVRVDNPLSGSITQINNTASVTDDGTFGADPTPENNTANDIDTLAATAPEINVSKTDTLWVDFNDNGMPSSGDVIRYSITITNDGNQDAAAVILNDSPDENTSLVIGSVTTSKGVIALGNAIGDTSVRVNLGDIPGAGGTATIQFSVTIKGSLPPDMTYVENQGITSCSNSINKPSDDPDYPGDDDPTITLLDTSFIKVLADTEQLFTEFNDVAIGEIVEYEVTLHIPPGNMRLVTLQDVLDQGLAFLGCISITPESINLTTNRIGDFNEACVNPVVSAELPGSSENVDQGRKILFDLGNLENTSSSNQALVIRYQAIVLDSIGNQDNTSLVNHVTWMYEGGSLSTSADPILVVEPDMQVSKSADHTSATNGTVITFSLSVNHTIPTSSTDAFNVILKDVLPPNLAYQVGTFTQISGPPAILDDADPTNLIATWAEYPLDAGEAVFEFRAIANGLSVGSSTVNATNLEWTSLPSDESLPRSGFNQLSTERFFDPLSDVNIYGASDLLTIFGPAPAPLPTPISPKPTLPASK